jgi:hypothetical protein
MLYGCGEGLRGGREQDTGRAGIGLFGDASCDGTMAEQIGLEEPRPEGTICVIPSPSRDPGEGFWLGHHRRQSESQGVPRSDAAGPL